MQVYCIFLFLSAAFLFGILVSQINEIVAGQQAMSKELDAILDAYFSIQPRHVVSRNSSIKFTCFPSSLSKL
jgi:hypothetical protein